MVSATDLIIFQGSFLERPMAQTPFMPVRLRFKASSWFFSRPDELAIAPSRADMALSDRATASSSWHPSWSLAMYDMDLAMLAATLISGMANPGNDESSVKRSDALA